MTNSRNNQPVELITTTLGRLSKGVDKVLTRWPETDRPSKLTLLNDLAAAIQPGANWGALKARNRQQKPAVQVSDNTSFIPNSIANAKVLPAKLFPIPVVEESTTIAELADDIQPLFGLTHDGKSIVGLELEVSEGNGYHEVSEFVRLILADGDELSFADPFAYDMSPEVARWVYWSVQSTPFTGIYPAFAQSGRHQVRVVFGPYKLMAMFSEPQGIRLLFDEDKAPSGHDLEICLRLISALERVQFQLSKPRSEVWKLIDFEMPNSLEEREMFRPAGGGTWTREIDFRPPRGYSWHMGSKLSEALDLSLALVDIDEPDVYLHAHLTPAPEHKRGQELPDGFRGGVHNGWQVLKLTRDKQPMVLALDEVTQQRLKKGFSGWAQHESHSITDDKLEAKVEALIKRDTRRATQHIQQVNALMNGADPQDEKLLKSLKA